MVLVVSLLSCGRDLPTEEDQLLPGDGVRLETTWEYRWGDSPRNDEGKFTYLQPYRAPDSPATYDTRESGDVSADNARSGTHGAHPGKIYDPGNQGKEGWSPLPFPGQPTGREGHDIVWQRVALPDGQWRDPALYIYSVDLIFEAYIDGELVYKYGNLNVEKPRFEGWPFHIIPLPQDLQGKYLYLRVYSNYPDIGIYHRVVLDDRADLIEWLLLSNVELLAFAGALLVIGAFSFLHFLRTRESWTHLAFALGVGVIDAPTERQRWKPAALQWLPETTQCIGVSHAPITEAILDEGRGVDDQVLTVLNLGIQGSNTPVVTLPTQLQSAGASRLVGGETTGTGVA